jgi:DNA modification methylase
MTAPVYERFGVTVHAGDCLDVLRELPDASVHAVVTDPPYGIGFMGRAWDQPGLYGSTRGDGRPRPAHPRDREAGKDSTAATAGSYDLSPSAMRKFQAWCTAWLAECLRVLRPGGHLLAFGGSRTWHRLACAVEDAGFEIRDSIAWLYASGFPKSLDVSKAIDKAAGAERVVVGTSSAGASSLQRVSRVEQGYRDTLTGCTPEAVPVTVPMTDAARDWEGWGTALKPGFEPIVVARKPLAGTVAGNVQEHGVGALNIDGCRVATDDNMRRTRTTALGVMNDDGWQPKRQESDGHAAGRWPSNVVITHAATPDGVDLCGDGCVEGCPVRDLDEQAGVRSSGKLEAHHERRPKDAGILGAFGSAAGERGYGDTGGASRFFPVFRFEAKAPAAERPRVDGVAHPTVKPLALMRWLVRLVTPPGGVVLDPFLGSGTTAHAARAEGFGCVGIEREETYLPLIRARLDGEGDGDLFGTAS